MRIFLFRFWIMVAACFEVSTAAGAVTHTIGNVTITPSSAIANTSMPFTVTAQIADPAVIPASVNLLVYNSSGVAAVISRLYDDGTHGDVTAGDGIYTVATDLSLPPGAELAVSAAFVGALKRVISPPIAVATIAAVPPTFAVNMGTVSAGGPLSIDNFNGAYEEGGAIPSGGAAIDITTVPLPPSINDYIQSETSDSTVVSTASIIISGVTCTEVTYSDSFPPALTIDSVTTYCPTGTQLIKFYLSYNSGDPSARQFLSDYQQVLNNAQLTP